MFDAPEGAYARVRVWNGAPAWLDALMDALASPAGEECRARARIAPDTLLRVAWADAQAADARTGRSVATAHARVAHQLGMSAKTVQRCRDLLIALGFAVEIVRGRHLTRLERAAARQGGSRQDRAASVRALTLPTMTGAVENVHPPRRGFVKRFSRVSEIKTNQHAQARAAEESQSGPRSRGTTPPRRPRRAYKPWPQAHIEFARRLQGRMPALSRYHAATVCRLLAQSQVDPDRWTVDSLLHILELSSNQRGGLYFQTDAAMRNPLAYTAAVLKNSIDPAAETPKEKRLREQAERETRREEERQAAISSPADSPARDAFFAMRRNAPRLRPSSTQAELVRQLIGPSKLYELTIAGQIAIAAVTQAHRRLTAKGWRVEISSTEITATSPDQSRTLTARVDDLHSPAPKLIYMLAGHAGHLRRGNIVIAAKSGNDRFDTKLANDNNSANSDNDANSGNGTVSAVYNQGAIYAENTNRVVDVNDNNGRILINGNNAAKSVNRTNVTNGDNDTV